MVQRILLPPSPKKTKPDNKSMPNLGSDKKKVDPKKPLADPTPNGTPLSRGITEKGPAVNPEKSVDQESESITKIVKSVCLHDLIMDKLGLFKVITMPEFKLSEYLQMGKWPRVLNTQVRIATLKPEERFDFIIRVADPIELYKGGSFENPDRLEQYTVDGITFILIES